MWVHPGCPSAWWDTIRNSIALPDRGRTSGCSKKPSLNYARSYARSFQTVNNCVEACGRGNTSCSYPLFAKWWGQDVKDSKCIWLVKVCGQHYCAACLQSHDDASWPGVHLNPDLRRCSTPSCQQLHEDNEGVGTLSIMIKDKSKEREQTLTRTKLTFRSKNIWHYFPYSFHGFSLAADVTLAMMTSKARTAISEQSSLVGWGNV